MDFEEQVKISSISTEKNKDLEQIESRQEADSSESLSSGEQDESSGSNEASPQLMAASPPSNITEGRRKSLFSKKLGPLGKWIKCVAIIRFDVELGQVLEDVYPSGFLNQIEQKAVLNMALPESNSFHKDQGDHFFLFRLRKYGEIPLRAMAPSQHQFAYAYTLYRQNRDANLPRGFSQRSYVILSDLPLFQFFKQLASLIDQRYEEVEGKIFLEELCEEIKLWGPPLPGKPNKVHYAGHQLIAKLPGKTWRQLKKPLLGGEYVFSESLPYTPFSELSIVNYFPAFHITRLWSLWELLITETPLMIYANSPADCSGACLVLQSLIYPLEYQGDFRSYLTLYEPDLGQFRAMDEARAYSNLLLGACNPYFFKLLLNFPATYLLSDSHYLEKKLPNPKSILPTLQNLKKRTKEFQGMLVIRETVGSSDFMPQNTSAFPASEAQPYHSPGKPNSIKQAPPSKRLSSGLLKPSFAVLKQLGLHTRDPESQDLLLRRHFFEFTRAFLAPFDMYYEVAPSSASRMAALSHEPYTGSFVAPPVFQLPLTLPNSKTKSLDPGQLQAQIKQEVKMQELNVFKPFDKKEFLNKLKRGDVSMPIVKDCGVKKEHAVKIYRKFIETVVFRRFLNKQQQEARVFFGLTNQK